MSNLKLKFIVKSEMSSTNMALTDETEPEPENDDTPIVAYRDLLVPSVCLLTVSLSLDSFYSRLGVPFIGGLLLPQFWIMNLALVVFLLATGVLWFYIQDYLQKEVLTYFLRRRSLNFTLKNSIDILVGFCVPCVVFPFWLSVREGTIECFLKHDCMNVFGVLYLGITDILCNTEPEEITGSNTPLCEGVIYVLPLLAFTAVPVILAILLHNYQVLHAMDDNSEPSTPETRPGTPAEIVDRVVPLPVTLPKGFRPAQIRLSLQPHHPPLSSSTVLGD